MHEGLTYIASPFSDPDPKVEKARFEAVCKFAANLMAKGDYVFSPIAHTYPIAQAGKLPGDWEYWKHYCRLTLGVCATMIVLKLPGWKESTGVQNEIRLAKEWDIPVEYVDP
jgi:hypothetical protein